MAKKLIEKAPNDFQLSSKNIEQLLHFLEKMER